MTPLRHAAILRACERPGFDGRTTVSDVRSRGGFRDGTLRRPLLSDSTIRAALFEASACGWFGMRFLCSEWKFTQLPRVMVTMDSSLDAFVDEGAGLVNYWDELGDRDWSYGMLGDLDARPFAPPSSIAACFGTMDLLALHRYIELAESVVLHLADMRPGLFRRFLTRRDVFESFVAWQHRWRIAIAWRDAMERADTTQPNRIKAPARQSGQLHRIGS